MEDLFYYMGPKHLLQMFDGVKFFSDYDCRSLLSLDRKLTLRRRGNLKYFKFSMTNHLVVWRNKYPEIMNEYFSYALEQFRHILHSKL